MYINPNKPLLMLVLAFSEHVTVVLTYIGTFSFVAFPLPGKRFFMIFRWFTFLLHKSQVLPEPLSEIFHFLPSSFSITLPSFIFLHNISLPIILSYIYVTFCLSASLACEVREVRDITCLMSQSLEQKLVHSRVSMNICCVNECIKQ